MVIVPPKEKICLEKKQGRQASLRDGEIVLMASIKHLDTACLKFLRLVICMRQHISCSASIASGFLSLGV